eukprot:TRINITY_DN5221_c0_g1_i1.p1 TRINITY_DN5221_c0_g1~~TRINITY_DN5221_c0_g1_i1.p1  ORF type:complete len:401 (-),score=94.83 TRINITY_DN5221_c0_g1_i1:1646-2848(-)
MELGGSSVMQFVRRLAATKAIHSKVAISKGTSFYTFAAPKGRGFSTLVLNNNGASFPSVISKYGAVELAVAGGRGDLWNTKHNSRSAPASDLIQLPFAARGLSISAEKAEETKLPDPASSGSQLEGQQEVDAAKGLKRGAMEGAGTATEDSDYWGIVPKARTRPDGSAWPWNSFRPSDTYHSNVEIDLAKHYKPKTWGDTFAYYMVKLLRVPTDIFFQRRYGCRAMMLETVAAVPGMVSGMLLHLQSLRRFEHTGGWIRALLDEAENERMHLMTFMEVAKPAWYERMLVLMVQGIFFNCYFLAYLISPRMAHRIVGYLEEEAIHSYTEFLKELDAGRIENVPAPAIAIDYWRLPKDAKLRDVVLVVRADEAHHRDVNHFASNVMKAGKQLKDNPAPVDYH